MTTDSFTRRVADMHWITDDLATGGDLSWNFDVAVRQLDEMVDAGVTHIIDMRQEWDDAAFISQLHPDVAYLHNPTDDAEGHTIPQAVFDRGVQFARQAFAEGGKVLAHCHMGINRGPSMALAILLDQGMDAIEAFDLLKAKRDICAIAYADNALTAHLRRMKREGNPHPDPVAELRRLHRHIKAVNSNGEVQRINKIIRGLRQADGSTLFR